MDPSFSSTLGANRRSRTTSICIIVPSRDDPLFVELAGMLSKSFAHPGVTVSIKSDGEKWDAGTDLLVMFGDCLRLASTSAALRSAGPGKPYTVLWQLEPFPPIEDYRRIMGGGGAGASLTIEKALKEVLRPFVPRVLRGRLSIAAYRVYSRSTEPSDPLYWGYQRLERPRCIEANVASGSIDHVFVSAPERVRLLEALGVPATFLPVGYHPDMGSDLGIPRDLDVVFIGWLKDNRKKTLHTLGADLRARGVELEVVDGQIYGTERAALLNRAKVSLNLVGRERELPRIRALLSIGCGALVVSDEVDDSRPFIPGQHFVSTSSRHMADAIARYVADESARKEIADRALGFLRSCVTMEGAAARLAAGISPSVMAGQAEDI